MNLVTAVDDIGSMNARSEGWAYFTLPEAAVASFESGAAEIRARTKLSAFHGKTFVRRFADSYKALLTLVRETVSSSSPSLLAVTLLNDRWKADYFEFCSGIISNSFLSSEVNDDVLTRASIALTAPLFTFQRLASRLQPDAFTRFEIDSDSITSRFTEVQLIVHDHVIDPTTPIFAAYNAYRAQRFQASPILSRGGIHITEDENNPLIQAVDVFANFSIAYAMQQLGKQSKTGDLKAGIFGDCFADLLSETTYESHVEIAGDDLVLKADGAWTLSIL